MNYRCFKNAETINPMEPSNTMMSPLPLLPNGVSPILEKATNTMISDKAPIIIDMILTIFGFFFNAKYKMIAITDAIKVITPSPSIPLTLNGPTVAQGKNEPINSSRTLTKNTYINNPSFVTSIHQNECLLVIYTYFCRM